MKRLTECPASPEEPRRRPPHTAVLEERKGAKRAKALPRRLARVERGRTGQILEVTSDEPLVAYGFPDEGPRRVDFAGARPDGVVLAELDGSSFVVFIELKSTGRDGRAEHGLDQVRAGALHFAPMERRGSQRAHGDDHHDAWTRGEDLPPVALDARHEVAGIAVVFRALPREIGLSAESMAAKTVTWAAVQVPMRGLNEASIGIRELLLRAQVPSVDGAGLTPTPHETLERLAM